MDIVNLNELIEEVLEELAYKMEHKSIRLKMEISRTEMIKQMNHDLVFQLFYNIINNAIRYNREDGEILLTEEWNGEGDFVVSIKDTGVGIRKEELGEIFDRFKKSGHVEGEGFGIGLSIVKSIATFLGLSVKVQSEIEKGTTFSIHIPGALVE